ncbi:MAG: hypothetical protein ACR2K6_03350, partial [Solirubrobacterales bacterium]
MLERRGVISGYEGSKPRQVLVGAGDVPRLLASGETVDESPESDPEPNTGGDPPTEEAELEEVSG